MDEEKIENGKDVEIDLPNVSAIGQIPVSEIPDYIRARAKSTTAVINERIEANRTEQSDIRTQLEGVSLGVKKITTKRARLARRARKDVTAKAELVRIQGVQRGLELEQENLKSALADAENELSLLQTQHEQQSKTACLELRDKEILPILRGQAVILDEAFDTLVEVLERHITLIEWAQRLSHNAGQERAFARLGGSLIFDVLNEKIRQVLPDLAKGGRWKYLENKSYADLLEIMSGTVGKIPYPEVAEIPELDDLDGENGVDPAEAT